MSSQTCVRVMVFAACALRGGKAFVAMSHRATTDTFYFCGQEQEGTKRQFACT